MAILLFDWAFLAVALAGTAAGGFLDLKTTEIPDIVPLSMVIAGAALHATRALFLWDFTLILWGLAVAVAFLAFGYLFYFTGQWGEADVLMWASVGFLIPQPLAMFGISSALSGAMWPLTFLLNMFIIGAVYSIIYAFILAVRSHEVFPAFWRDVKGHARILFAVFALTSGLLIGLLAVMAYMYALPATVVFSLPLILTLPAILAMLLLYRFARVMEKTVFRKKISTARLREGDVIAEDVKLKSGKRISSRLYIGLTKKQVAKIRALKKNVTIKEGIRYSPTFFFTILATWAFGNILFWILGVAI